jgi:hypothetical protein
MATTVGMALLGDPVRRRLYQVLARRALNWESGSAIVEWAEEALLAGRDYKPLAVLAGLDKPPNEFETDRWLADTFKSLGLAWPDKAELLDLLAITVAGDIVAGTVAPDVGCKELSKLCWATGYTEKLKPFYAADDELDLARQGIYGTVGSITEDILKAARRLVEAVAP